MNFANVTALTIPEGSVSKILSGNTVLWKKPLLPSAYKQVDCIINPSNAYIDTGFKHNNNTRVVMKVQATAMTAIAFAFEGRSSDTLGVKGLFYHYGYGDKWRAGYNVATNHLTFDTVVDLDLLEIDYNKNVCTVNGETVTYTAATFQSNHNLYLLARNQAGTANGFLKSRLYYCKIYNNGTLIRDYYPCKRKSDSVYGLYDLVNGKFYTSPNGTEFTGG